LEGADYGRSGFVPWGIARVRRALSENSKRFEMTLAPVLNGAERSRAPCLEATTVLIFLSLLQLILYIPLLALAGQGLLFVLAGPKRDTNFFYRLLQLLSKPFTLLVRKITPAKVGDHQVPIVTFFLVMIAYAVVSFEKIDLCMRVGLELCR
jgi:hypothetical protein